MVEPRLKPVHRVTGDLCIWQANAEGAAESGASTAAVLTAAMLWEEEEEGMPKLEEEEGMPKLQWPQE